MVPSSMLHFEGVFHTWSGTGKTTISLQGNTLHRQIVRHWKATYMSFPMIYTPTTYGLGLLEKSRNAKEILNLYSYILVGYQVKG